MMRYQIVTLFLYLLILVSNINYVQCQEPDKIIGKRGNAYDTDSDILEVNFGRYREHHVHPDILLIRFSIDGNFVENYTYAIYFYDDQISSNYFGFLGLYYSEDEGKFNALYSQRGLDKNYRINVNIKGSTALIWLTLSHIEERKTFYASAVVLKPLYHSGAFNPYDVEDLDVEPRSRAVPTMEHSRNYHEMIYLHLLSYDWRSPEESLSNETTHASTITTSNSTSQTTTIQTEFDDRETQEHISKPVNYTPYYLITFGIIVAGALIAMAIYRKKEVS